MKGRVYFAGFVGFIGLGLMVGGCVHTKTELSKEMAPNYVYKEPKKEMASPGSLWRESAGLFEDRKARGLNDLVTINIVESASATKKADTSTGRASSMDAGISGLFGSSLKYDLKDIIGNLGVSGAVSPSISASNKNSFSGSGSTTRSDSFVATITARVIEVLPNGNFLIESRKDITVNREKQVLLLRGVIRPDDIAYDNTISSNYVANAEMIYTGDGVVNDKQGQGWLVRLLDYVWPF